MVDFDERSLPLTPSSSPRVLRQGWPKGAHDVIIAATARASQRAIVSGDRSARHTAIFLESSVPTGPDLSRSNLGGCLESEGHVINGTHHADLARVWWRWADLDAGSDASTSCFEVMFTGFVYQGASVTNNMVTLRRRSSSRRVPAAIGSHRCSFINQTRHRSGSPI